MASVLLTSLETGQRGNRPFAHDPGATLAADQPSIRYGDKCIKDTHVHPEANTPYGRGAS